MKTLFPFQEHGVKWLLGRIGQASMLCFEQGLGKTVVTARTLQIPAIIVCPAFLQYNWYDEVEEHSMTATLVREQADLFKRVDVYIMSFHFLVNLDLAVVLAQHFVVDEFHFAKSLQAKRTLAVCAEIECTPTITLLSGTPIPSRPIEIYPMLDAIGAYDRGYYSFAYRFCNAHKTDWGLDVNGAGNLEQLAEIIAPYMLRFTKKQVLKQLPEKIYRVLSLDIDVPPEEKDYDLEEFKHVRPDIAFETLSTIMRLHAMLKFPSVCEFVDHYLEIEDKLIVFAHHRAEMLDPLFEKYSQHSPARIVGGMNAKQKRAEEKRFQEDPDCRIIVIGILAGGVGLTLTAASRVLLAESSWVPGDIDQAADRAHRIGQLNVVNVDILTVRGSIDEYQLRRALEKLNVTNQLVKESILPMSIELKEKIQALREIADEMDALLDTDDDEEEEEKPKRGRRKAAAEKTPRRRRGKAAEEEEEDDTEEEEEEKPKRGRRKAAAKKTPTRRRRGKAAEEDDEEEEEEPKPKRGRRKAAAKKGASLFDEVRAKASELMKATDRGTLSEVLEVYGAAKVTELEEDDYKDFIDDCDAAIEEAE